MIPCNQFDDLPTNAITNIARYLPFSDLISMSFACKKTWGVLCSKNTASSLYTFFGNGNAKPTAKEIVTTIMEFCNANNSQMINKLIRKWLQEDPTFEDFPLYEDIVDLAIADRDHGLKSKNQNECNNLENRIVFVLMEERNKDIVRFFNTTWDTAQEFIEKVREKYPKPSRVSISVEDSIRSAFCWWVEFNTSDKPIELKNLLLQSIKLCPCFRNLNHINLDNVSLRGVDLSDTNLSNDNLIGADLSKANLSRANLKQADLSKANLSEANLSRANLFLARMSETNLENADLIRANLYGANLSKADLRGADLSGADLNGADLNGANLSGANLSGADLSDADLENAKLNNTIGLGTDDTIRSAKLKTTRCGQ